MATGSNTGSLVSSLHSSDSDNTGGYLKEAFVKKEAVENIQCNYCKNVPRESILVGARCGHRFCNHCFTNRFDADPSPVTCEKCLSALASYKQIISGGATSGTAPLARIFRPDMATRNLLNKLETKCPNQGCNFTGPFSEYEKHFFNCEFETIDCPNHCHEKFLRGKLQDHFQKCQNRPLQCAYCHKNIGKNEWDVHQRTCEFLKSACAHCGILISKNALQRHLTEECTKLNICPFGCESINEANYELHYKQNSEKHMLALARKLKVLEGDDVYKVMDHLSKLSEPDLDATWADLKSSLQNQFPFSALNQQVRKLTLDPPAQGGTTSESGTELAIPLANTQSPGVLSYTQLAQLLGEDKEYDGINAKVTDLESKCAALKIAIETSYKKLLENESSLQTGESKNKEMEKRLQKMEDVMRNKNKDVAVIQRRLNHLECTSWDGLFVWRINNVNQKLTEARAATSRQNEVRSTSLYSPTFFTHQAGYRLRLRIFLNGEPGTGESSAAGKFVSLFICVCRGQYDAILPWPFRRNVVLLILDQNSTRKHIKKSIRQDSSVNAYQTAFKRPEQEMNVPIGFTQFAQLDDIYKSSQTSSASSGSSLGQNPVYVHQDTMFIKCIVEPVDY